MKVICMLGTGAKSGKGHFKVVIVPSFSDRCLRLKGTEWCLILGGLLETDIHAINLDTSAPD